MHRLVVGMSGAGKSRMTREYIIPAWRRQRRPVGVLDPVRQAWGDVQYQTDDPYAFLAWAQQSRGCILIIDECDESLRGSADQERKLKYLATRSRNDGHLAYFLAQRAMQVPPSYRNQCSWGYVFQQTAEDAEICYSLLNCPALRMAPGLPLGTCIHVRPGQNPSKIRVF